ncbi:MAG: nucleotide exchange factor GrpE [Defluviitaleaceae bacterium]|nr:nucleotide exchange factor GrpE [Defluviitaleaceae bacterium]
MKGKNKETPANQIEELEIEIEEVEESEETESNDTPEVIEAEEDADYKSQLDQAQDRLKRNLAEFDNFRKRTAKEMAARYDAGQSAAAEKLLPIIDNFQRALSANEDKEDNFYQGIALIARQFEGVLTDMGIEPITDETGTPFDHNLHHAVAHIEDEAYGQNEIVEVLQKGYKHRDKVLRPSMVKVAN